MAYYSERHGMRKKREKTYDVSIEAYNMILDIAGRYWINLAWKFPKQCPDNDANICGIDIDRLDRDLRIEIPELFNDEGLNFPKKHYNVFDGESVDDYNQYALFDYVEYIAMNVKDYVIKSHHSFFSHNHYEFLRENKTFNVFIDEINHTFAKIGLLYRMNENGEVERIVENETMIKKVEKQTSTVLEKGLKELIEEAISLYRDPNTAKVKDATEKLWDAFERLKSYYTSMDKKLSVEKVILSASSGNSDIKELLDLEFRALTKIGNNYRIRHHETDKIDVTDLNHYEYFFNRCLSAILLALKYI